MPASSHASLQTIAAFLLFRSILSALYYKQSYYRNLEENDNNTIANKDLQAYLRLSAAFGSIFKKFDSNFLFHSWKKITKKSCNVETTLV